MSGDSSEWVKPVTLPAQYVGFLQGIIAGCLHGSQRDLQNDKGLIDSTWARRESDALSRLLTGLERGELRGPDEVACKVVRKLAMDADVANDYTAVIKEHEALHGLLGLIEGADR